MRPYLARQGDGPTRGGRDRGGAGVAPGYTATDTRAHDRIRGAPTRCPSVGRPAATSALGTTIRAGVRQGLRLFPYPMQIWVNGQSGQTAGPWPASGRRAVQRGRQRADPRRCRRSATGSGPGDRVFAERWRSMLPLPPTEHDRAAGYWWERRCARSRPRAALVRDAPRRPARSSRRRSADDLDIGRPELIELTFERGRRRGATAGGKYQTHDRHLRHRGQRRRLLPARPHQAVSEGRRALRIETVVDRPTIRAAYGACSISPSCSPAPERSTPPCSILNVSVRAASLRVQPLSGSHSPPSPRMAGGSRTCGSATLGSRPWPAPCAPACIAVTGISNKSLRALMTGLLGGTDYTTTPGQLRPGPATESNGLIDAHPGQESLPSLTGDADSRSRSSPPNKHDRCPESIISGHLPNFARSCSCCGKVQVANTITAVSARSYGATPSQLLPMN